MLVTLQNYPAVPNISKTFQIQVQCEVLSIKTIAFPTDQTYRLLLDKPIVLQFGFLEYPLCGLTYAVSP